jgi:hypothetical protein
MKIDSYSITASSERTYMSYDSIKTAAKTISVGTNAPAAQGPAQAAFSASPGAPVAVDLSADARKAIEEARSQPAEAEKQAAAGAGGAQEAGGLHGGYARRDMIEMLRLLLYRLTGRRYDAEVLRGEGARPLTRRGQQAGRAATPELAPALVPASSLNAARALAKETTVTHYESETMRYDAQGLIRTADGKTMSVDVSLSMSREFTASLGISQALIQTAVTDPLVINYGGAAASLTAEKYDFDLDVDGVSDRISFAGEGSGFLALDKNGDGKINDGSELFGPQSGSGFGELRDYDVDRNGWIDENDGIFSKLLVWSKDRDGNDILMTLKEADVGAIFLGDVPTQYTLGEYSGNSDGEIRSTSIYLKEGGGAGVVQHIDLSI